MKKILLTISVIAGCTSWLYSQTSFYDVLPANGNGLRFWSSDNYKIHMGTGSEYMYGPVTDYSIKMNMSNTVGRGWTWGVTGLTPVAALNTSGDMQISGSFKAITNVQVGNKFTVGNALNNTLSSTGIVLGEDKNNLEFLNSSWGNGYGAKLYGTNDGDGLTSFRLAVRGNSTSWSDAFYVRAADNGSGGGRLGFIGIGTIDPKARLDVHESTPLGQSIGDHQLLFRVSGRGNNTIMHNQWLLRDAPGSEWWYTRLHDGISVDASHLTPGINTLTWWERDPNGNIQSWGNADQTYLTINQGYVGIGTTSPDAKLAVKGTVHAQEVKVDLSVPGPDYVFEPTYQLPSLTEIENYIKANKHLPEVPSAKEMETNGINLSEMNMLLLKKVEELMLYQIEANRKIELLQNHVQELLQNRNKK
jgi:Phage T4 tail fibre